MNPEPETVAMRLRRPMLAMLACVALYAPGARSRAQEPVLFVRPLRDGGGLPSKLQDRLTLALERFLADQPGRPVVVTHLQERGAPGSGVGRYLIEGDLSFASGSHEGAGRFLITMRLFRLSTPAALVGQWAGSATSLRYLTANLRREPDVHTFGLVGELGSRLVTALNEDNMGAAQRLRRIAVHAGGPEAAMPRVVTATDPPALLRDVSAGTAFRVRFGPASAGRRCRVLVGVATGELHPAPLSAASHELVAQRGRTEISAVVQVPDGASEVWLLWSTPGNGPSARRAPGATAVSEGTCRAAQGGAPIERASAHTAVAAARSGPPPAAGERSVQVLDGVAAGRAEPDPESDLFLSELTRDSARWHIWRMPVVPVRH